MKLIHANRFDLQETKYMVYNPLKEKPMQLHSRDDAYKEAERLSLEYPKVFFYVIKIDGYVFGKVDVVTNKLTENTGEKQ